MIEWLLVGLVLLVFVAGFCCVSLSTAGEDCDMSEIGAEILRRRKAHGWSRKDLMVECRRTGGDLSYGEIVRIEQGKVQPRTHTLVQIAAALGVQPYELLPVNGSKPAHAPRPVPGLAPVVKLLQVVAHLGGFAAPS